MCEENQRPEAKAKAGLKMRTIEVALDHLQSVHRVKNPESLWRYKCILASVREVGMIEPLSIYPRKEKPGNYLLIDGHMRFLALKQLGYATAECIAVAIFPGNRSKGHE